MNSLQSEKTAYTLDYSSILRKNVADSVDAKLAIVNDEGLIDAFSRAIQVVVNAYQKGGRLYVAGNGGSAADAQHLVAEFVSKLATDRAPLPAESLTTDSSILTAIGNDYGYEYIFSRQLKAKLKPNDVFLGITTSGNSANIISALEICRILDCPSIVFSGHEGGKVSNLADFLILAPGERTSTIQESHILLCHTLCEAVELVLFSLP